MRWPERGLFSPVIPAEAKRRAGTQGRKGACEPAQDQRAGLGSRIALAGFRDDGLRVRSEGRRQTDKRTMVGDPAQAPVRPGSCRWAAFSMGWLDGDNPPPSSRPKRSQEPGREGGKNGLVPTRKKRTDHGSRIANASGMTEFSPHRPSRIFSTRRTSQN